MTIRLKTEKQKQTNNKPEKAKWFLFPHESNHESVRQNRHWGEGSLVTDRIPEVGVGEARV